MPDIFGVKVLLVENDDDSRRLLAMMLERQGADVTAVSSSSEATRALVRTASGSDRVDASPVSSASDRVEASPVTNETGSDRVDASPVSSGSDRVDASPVTNETASDRIESSPVSICSGRPPDIIISDIGMAEEDGYELMRKVRALPPEQGGLVPAIALTGYATPKDRERALAAGYQLHLAKPVESEDLVAAIVSLVGRRQ